MNHKLDYDQLVEPLISLLKEFLQNDLDQAAFQNAFKTALSVYETTIGGRGYAPLATVANPEKHNLSHYLRYCQEALDRLPKEALDRSTRQWVVDQLVIDDGSYSYFNFHHSSEVSLFGRIEPLYTTAIDGMSFLLSGLNGTFVRPKFNYKNLLQVLKRGCGDALATWVYGTEPDGMLAQINKVWSLGNVYEEVSHLQNFEHSPSPEGGNSYLLLLPKSKAWMLLHRYDSQEFTIELHAQPGFIQDLRQRLNL